MADARAKNNVGYLLSHPVVLKAAWAKVLAWYSSGEMKPEPEFSSWLLCPDDHLSQIGESLAAGTFKVSPFPLVPYPKKNSSIRHFSFPSVKDQVAFAVFGILLAPFLETRMYPFSFGNRWYRGVYKKPQHGKYVWAQRPFFINDRQFYQPYRRAHGLFRRSCHWSVTRMLSMDQNVGGTTDHPITPEDYPSDSLPIFLKDRNWWVTTTDGSEKKGYYANLDIQLAYPSVSLDFLSRQLTLMLSDFDGVSDDKGIFDISNLNRDLFYEHYFDLLAGYPSDIRNLLVYSIETRFSLANTLVDMLRDVRYESFSAEESLWLPPHYDCSQTLPEKDGSEHPGLPTGLCISGLLLNTYLFTLDKTMNAWLFKSQKNNLPAAYFRFADDMVLLAPQLDTLIDGIDYIWAGIAGTAQSVPLANSFKLREGGNLRINWTKVGPPSISDLVDKYLENHKWKECDGCKRHIVPPTEEEGNQKTFYQWFKSIKDDNSLDSYFSNIEKEAIIKGRLGQFVTYLVERLSELGSDKLFDRFGKETREKLTRLHELIRLDLDDAQIRTDTRLSFAVNRLANAWLPEDSWEDDSLNLSRMRESISEAIRQVPWKFSLWRAALRVAVRMPMALSTTAHYQDSRANAEKWLRSLLEDISTDAGTKGSWLRKDAWPEEEIPPKCWTNKLRQNGSWKHYYLSYIRSVFWRAIADVISELTKLSDGIESTALTQEHLRRSLSSKSWIFRAIPEKEIHKTLKWLSQLERWARSLYKNIHQYNSEHITRTEVNSIALALLTCTDRTELMHKLKEYADLEHFPLSAIVESSDRIIQIPLSIASLRSSPIIKNLLINRAIGLKKTEWNSSSNKINYWALIYLSKQEHIKAEQPMLDDLAKDFRHNRYITVTHFFNLNHRIPVDVIDHWTKILPKLLNGIANKDMTIRFKNLYAYSQVRNLIMSSRPLTLYDRKSEQPTIYDLIWGDPWNSSNLRTWNTAPAHAPELGLPTRVAIKMLGEAIDRVLKITDKKSTGRQSRKFYDWHPIWRIHRDAEKMVAHGRRLQFGFRDAYIPDKIEHAIVVDRVPSTNRILLHPAFYLPQALGIDFKYIELYETFFHILTFIFSVDGSERILDTIFRRGPTGIPFDERWDLRSTIHLPPDTWQCIDKIIRILFNGARRDNYTMDSYFTDPEIQNESAVKAAYKLTETTDLFRAQRLSHSEFLWEKADITLELGSDGKRTDIDIPQVVKPFWEYADNVPDKEPISRLNIDRLWDEIRIRMGQISAHPDWIKFIRNKLTISRYETQDIMRQVLSVFSSDNQSVLEPGGASSTEIQMLVFPEVTLPESEVRTIINLVKEKRQAAFIGCIWKVLNTSVKPHSSFAPTKYFLVNEALLAVPISLPGDSGPPLVRKFFVRKPIPTYMDYGVAGAMTEVFGGGKTEWHILPGSRWYRFLHPNWGDFTVAICSDLLDPSPWFALRGEVMHLFQCSYNEDIALFEALTWIRAYENFLNVVSVNHGSAGGTFAWTPKHHPQKELAVLRGAGLFLKADVDIPVKSLYYEQCNGSDKAIRIAIETWKGNKPSKKGLFKPPPPSFKEKRGSLLFNIK